MNSADAGDICAIGTVDGMSEHVLRPVAFVTGGRTDRRDDGWASEVATIDLVDSYGAESIAGLDEFSHAEIVFRFHALTDDDVTTDARHPRGNRDWPKVGIFAQRGSKRPNRLAVSVCEVVEIAGRAITVRGLDAIDGTPVLDIKPVMREFLPRGEIVQPAWSSALMEGYWHGDEIPDDDG